MSSLPPLAMTESRYKEAGVDIDAGARAVDLIQAQSRLETQRFAHGIPLPHDAAPCTLVATTDGVGTKTLLAAELGRLEGLGADIVHHCLNDLLTVRARPAMFLDYIGMHAICPDTVALLVDGMRRACEAAGCRLVGGETAEMPDVYHPDTFEIVGTMMGLAPVDVFPRVDAMQPGDQLVGLPSNGPHTNGYTLIRAIMAERDCQAPIPSGRESWTDALLRPHRSYGPHMKILDQEDIPLLGIAHITGGGFFANVERLLPAHLGAVIDTRAWQPPLLFRYLVEWGRLQLTEAYRVFNMGIGLVLVCTPGTARAIAQILPESVLVGHLESGSGVRLL